MNNATIDGASYSVDAAGNRTAKTDQFAAVTSNYTYDALYQLTQVVQGGNTTESYSYDAVGNRTASLGVSSYTTNASNEMTANSNASYTYDSNGNTTSKTVGSDTTTYAWDYENRLTSVTLPNSGGTVYFKYDPMGRRIYKALGSTVSVYAYDGDNLIEEANSSGTAVARYAQGLSVDEPLAMLRSSATSYYNADGLGSVTSLANGSGALTQTYTYDSFGKQTASSGSLTNTFQYTGRESDSETGLYYYRARYYDTQTGRFLNEDPIAADLNYYRYVTNRPTQEIDPSGLFHLNPLPDNHIHHQDDIDDACKSIKNPAGETGGGCNRVYYELVYTGCETCPHQPDFTVTLIGDIYVANHFPYKPERGRPLDPSVVNPATALAHEKRHTDDMVNAIRQIFVPAEHPYPTAAACEAAAVDAALRADVAWGRARAESQRRRH